MRRAAVPPASSTTPAPGISHTAEKQPNANTNYPNSDTVETSYAGRRNGSVPCPPSGGV